MSQPKKILFVANVHWFYLHFQLPYLQWLTEMGHEVHVAADGSDQVPFVSWQLFLPIQRSPFSWKNIKAYVELKKIIRENKYDLIHCHTPMGGVMGRLAARGFRKKTGLKVLYTAHGFHFYKGAPLSYWLFYFPVEKMLSRFTDGLITINREDFENARRLGFSRPEIYRINGIGVNTVKFKPASLEEKKQFQKRKGYSEHAFILVYAAEFISRKNHQFILDALSLLLQQIPELKVIFAGAGRLKEEIVLQAEEKGLSETVEFAGYRNDMEKLMCIADVGISSSRMEGLPMNVAEAMFCGLPVVVSRIRGHVDLVTHRVNGLLYDEGNTEEFVRHILDLYHSPGKRQYLGTKARETVVPFGIDQVIHNMTGIYQKYLS